MLGGKISLVLSTHNNTLHHPTLLGRGRADEPRHIVLRNFGHRGVGINRSGHDTFVPEQPANGFELRSVTEHGGGETMTKHVGGFLLLTGD